MPAGIAIVTYNRKASLQELVRRLEPHTRGDYRVVVADDGSTDGTQEWVREQGLPLVTGVNRGLAWNKNRGLAWLWERTDCDPLILLEDDVRVWEDGWNEDWIEAGLRWGHVNYALDGGAGAQLGSGTPKDPYWSGVFGGQCTVTSREAFQLVGYLDSRFRKGLCFGREHVEWSDRYRKALWRRWTPAMLYFPTMCAHVGAEWDHSWNPGSHTPEWWLEQLLAAQPLWRDAGLNPVEATLMDQELALSEAPNGSALRRLRELYYEYVTTVSTVEMAISWQLSAWLWNWLEEHRPGRVLDLGSGFSSVLFRLWRQASKPETRIVSADTDLGWLEKTAAFLQRSGLSTDGLARYPEVAGAPFDLVLFDLADRERRGEQLDAVANLVAEGGTLVLDDIDYPPYEAAASAWAATRGWAAASEPSTRDRLLRFSRMLVRADG
jgi:glycosyltransferase involved in cell wall biosynthesis/predicted O-methyltransferase YrrM